MPFPPASIVSSKSQQPYYYLYQRAFFTPYRMGMIENAKVNFCNITYIIPFPCTENFENISGLSEL